MDLRLNCDAFKYISIITYHNYQNILMKLILHWTTLFLYLNADGDNDNDNVHDDHDDDDDMML